jgi:arylsulfatase A-like enzyme
MKAVSRRAFVRQCAGGAAAVPLFARSAEGRGPQRPNILWLVSEDNGPFLGCYGDPQARTPNLDALARKGVVFESCHAMPVCAPSRFTLITGMYPTTCGPAHNMRASGKIPAWLEGFPAYLRRAGYYTTNNAKTDYNAPIDAKAAWDACSKKADWRGRPTPQTPFFSVYNHEVTHESCLFPAQHPRVAPAADPAQMRVRPYQPDTPEVRADIARQYDCIAEMDRQCGLQMQALAESGADEDTVVFYYGDNGGVTPRSKRFLQDTGTHVPLIVYFPPKWRHLAPAAPGARIAAPVHFVDFAATVLAIAGVERPAYMQGVPFAGAERAAPRRYAFCSRDRMDERTDMVRSVTDGHWLYIRNFRPEIPYVEPLSYMFRARGYQSWARLAEEGKLTPATAMFWGRKPTEELYDNQADPDNVVNLAGRQEHAERRAAMRQALRAHMTETRDNGLLPEGCEDEGYDASRKPGAWPVGRALDAAFLASANDAANVPALVRLAEDPAMPVRWWAALGCGILGKQAESAEPALRKLLGDPSGFVRVAAADALARQGKVDLALPVLQKAMEDLDSPWCSLQACNSLDRLGESARPLLPAIQAFAKRVAEDEKFSSLQAYPRRILGHLLDVLEGRAKPLAGPSAVGAPPAKNPF